MARFGAPGSASPEWTPIVALGEDNRLILGPVKAPGRPLLELDREKRTWVPIALTGRAGSDSGYTLGFDGLSLFTFAGLGHLRWWTPAGPAMAK